MNRHIPRIRPFKDGPSFEQAWWQYFYDLHNLPIWFPFVAREQQTAAIAATTLIRTPLNQPGLYRISFTLGVTRAAGTSSELTLRLRFPRNSVAQVSPFAGFSGNDTASSFSNTRIIRADKNSEVTYEVDYTSVGSPSLEYSLDIQTEHLL